MSKYLKLFEKAKELDSIDYDYKNIYDSFMKANTEKDLNNLKNKIPEIKINENAEIKKQVCIGICVKDCEKYIIPCLKKILMICKCFHKSSIIFYENGSTDRTRLILKKFCDNTKSATLIYENYNIKKYTRTMRIARGRNICLNICKEIKPDYYIVFDCDDVNLGLKKSLLLNCFKQNFEWDALFANQDKIYYDLYALRTYNNWMNYNCWEASKFIPKQIAVYDKFKKIPKNKIIPVISAFGGLGIYKWDSIKDYFYYGYKNNKPCCEHVHLNKQMIKNNKKLFILGSLINHYHISDNCPPLHTIRI